MTTPQQFIEDAITGGYSGTSLEKGHWYGVRTWSHTLDTNDDQVHFMAMLLDPLAWQAVGKTRGWYESYMNWKKEDKVLGKYRVEWRLNMHHFIDYIADGKTIEEALAAIA